MSFTFLKTLPTPAEIRAQYPLSARGQQIKAAKDRDVRDVITGLRTNFW